MDDWTIETDIFSKFMFFEIKLKKFKLLSQNRKANKTKWKLSWIGIDFKSQSVFSTSVFEIIL